LSWLPLAKEGNEYFKSEGNNPFSLGSLTLRCQVCHKNSAFPSRVHSVLDVRIANSPGMFKI
jgi:hypothetical protein